MNHPSPVMNVWGFADPLANEILRHAYEDEMVQMVGRMRGCIPDPEGVEARAYVLAHVAAPGWPVDKVLGLDDLREGLGLQRLSGERRGPKPSTGPEKLANRIRDRGRPATIAWLAKGIAASGVRQDERFSRGRDVVETVDRLLQEAGHAGLSEAERREAFSVAKGTFGEGP